MRWVRFVCAVKGHRIWDLGGGVMLCSRCDRQIEGENWPLKG